jgi:CRISPR-associated endonuclease/helicase Cas3
MRTSHFFKLKSHPDKFLKDHLENVGRLSREIISSKSIEHREVFAEVSYLIGIAHDFGKATRYFQEWLEKGERTQLAQHGALSALVGYLMVRDFLIERQKLKEFPYLPAIVWIVINKHHGDLENILDGEIKKLREIEDRPEIVKRQLENIFSYTINEVIGIYSSLGYQDISKILEELNKNLKSVVEQIRKDIKKFCYSDKENLERYFLILLFYSVLLDADKLDASGRGALPKRLEISSDIVDRYKKSRFSSVRSPIDVVREEAYRDIIKKLEDVDVVKERIFSINLPTGCGKTLTGLSFALKLRKKVERTLGFTPRIIYSLPFLSIIDQNAKIIEDVLRLDYSQIPSNLLLVHHHLADIRYKEVRDGELNIEELNRSLLLIEGWHSEIVVTTFVQIFHSLITNRNRAARKFHNIINSVIILDEVQSIPHRYWLLVSEVLKYLAEKFNCWIILMTATRPFIFRNNEIKELVTEPEKYFKMFNRVVFNFNLEPISLEEFKHKILDDIKNTSGDVLIILNTINSCKEIYEFLKNEFAKVYDINADQVIDEDGIANFPEFEIINLSTHVLPIYRLRRIDRIRNKDVDLQKRRITVTTQLVEAGVDISADIVYRDFAPLDCLIQSAGRCNRNMEEEKGVFNIVVLKDGKQEFYKYIYDLTLTDATMSVIRGLDNNRLEEKDFVFRVVNEYYKLISDRGSKDDSKEILESIYGLHFSEISKFDLIQEKLPSIALFIEIDELAENVRKEVENILKTKKSFERGLQIMEKKRELNCYTINVRYSEKIKNLISSLPCIDDLEEYRYISRYDLNKYYRIDSGFYLEEFEDVSIL